jgi:hypothetical protein
VSAEQEPLLLLVTSTLHGHELPLNVPRRQKPILLLTLSTLPRPVLLTNVSSLWGLSFTKMRPLQGLELQLNVSRQLLLDFSTLQGPELHLDVSTLQRPVLHV